MIHDAPQELHIMLNRVYNDLLNSRVHSNNKGTPETKASVHARQGLVSPTPGSYPSPLPVAGLALILSEYIPPKEEEETKKDEENKEEKSNN